MTVVSKDGNMPKLQNTKRQREYLAFISQYQTLMGVSPSEGDIAAFFGVAGSSAHQMLVALEKTGALNRIKGVARSIQLLVDSTELPLLGWAGSKLRPEQGNTHSVPIVAALELADFLACRICEKQAIVLAKIGPVSRLAERVVRQLQDLGAPENLIDVTREYLVTMPWEAERRAEESARSPRGRRGDKPTSETSMKRQGRSLQDNPNQGTLFGDHG